MSYKTYLALFIGLVALVILGSLRMIPTGFWPWVFLMILLEFPLLKKRATIYRLILYLFPAILVFGLIQITADRSQYQQFRYRIYETIPILLSLLLYQLDVYKMHNKGV